MWVFPSGIIFRFCSVLRGSISKEVETSMLRFWKFLALGERL